MKRILNKKKLKGSIKNKELYSFVLFLIIGAVITSLAIYFILRQFSISESYTKLPWTFFTALIVGPLTLYIWFWRIKNDKNKIDDDRLQKAVENLSNEKINIRIAGLYILENLIENNPLRTSNVLEIICSYFRTKEHDESTETEDKICLDIVSRIWSSKQKYWDYDKNGEPDLRGINVDNMQMWHIHLNNFFLENTSFKNCYLKLAQLQNSYLAFADFENAFLEDANLHESKLYCTDLRKAKGLRGEQLEKALGCNGTKLPNEISKPEKWSEMNSSKCHVSYFCHEKKCVS